MTEQTTVTEIAPSRSARALSLLERIDYADSFLVPGGAAKGTAEEWARAMIEGAPGSTRQSLVRGWALIGLKHGEADDPDRVLGWEMRRRSEDVVLLGADSRIGMPGELLFQRAGDDLTFATFIRQGNPFAKALWATIAPNHRRIVSTMLAQAASRPRAQSVTESSIGRGSQPSSSRARALDM